MILYRCSKEKFCLGHSWEVKGLRMPNDSTVYMYSKGGWVRVFKIPNHFHVYPYGEARHYRSVVLCVD